MDSALFLVLAFSVFVAGLFFPNVFFPLVSAATCAFGILALLQLPLVPRRVSFTIEPFELDSQVQVRIDGRIIRSTGFPSIIDFDIVPTNRLWAYGSVAIAIISVVIWVAFGSGSTLEFSLLGG